MIAGLAMLGGIGPPELLIILGVAVLVFGAGRIPEVARSLGKALKEFKKIGDDISNDIKDATNFDTKDE